MIDPREEMQIKVPDDKGLRELVQKKLFSLGFKWALDTSGRLFNNWYFPYICLNSSDCGDLTQNDTSCYKEISLYDLFENLPCLNTTGKLPYITDSGKTVSRETINSLLKDLAE